MARRSDHSRPELRALILEQAHAHMAEVGFARFSAREVAKRIGYAVGTIYNVYGTLDGLIAEVNTRTFTLWADAIERDLAKRGGDRIVILVEGYFQFARANTNLWHAIYNHRPEMSAIDEAQSTARGRLTGIIVSEVADALGAEFQDLVEMTPTLIATVHGLCAYDLSGAFEMMGVHDAEARALYVVRSAMTQFTADRDSAR